MDDTYKNIEEYNPDENPKQMRDSTNRTLSFIRY